MLQLVAMVAGAAAANVAPAGSECIGVHGNCLCDDGVTQSPINLHTCNKDIDGEIYNIPYEREKMAPSYQSEIGTLKRRCNARNECNLILVPQNDVTHSNNLNVPGFGTYNLEECVIRWRSEHTVNGMRYPLEVQCHHTLEGTGTKRKGIVSTFYENGQSEENGETTSPFIAAFESKLPYGNEEVKLDAFQFTPTGTAGATRYYSYRGSQTDPSTGCLENADWFVMYDPTGISKAQLAKLGDAMGRNESDKTTWMAPRHLQNLYGRHQEGCHHHHDAAPAVGCFLSLAVVFFSVLGRA